MGIAYSKSPIVRGPLRIGSRAEFRSDLDALLFNAGWRVKAAVTNGFRYTIKSPDGFECKVLVVDDTSYVPQSDLYQLGNYNSVVVQFMSSDEVRIGYPHRIYIGPGIPLQAVAGICQLFISLPGTAAAKSAQVAGGIPARPANAGPCVSGIGASGITDLWWSCGGSLYWDDAISFRSGPNANGGSSYCQNGVVSNFEGEGTDPFAGKLSLFPLTPTRVYEAYQHSYPVVTYRTLTPLNIDAFVGWDWQIRGQLWDAFLQTSAIGQIDDLRTFFDTDADGVEIAIQAIAWHVSFYSTLQLIYGSPVSAGGGGNVAY